MFDTTKFITENVDGLDEAVMDGVPIIVCRDGPPDSDGRPTWVFDCRYCGELHSHGGMEGFRSAHCYFNTESPYHCGGYYLLHESQIPRDAWMPVELLPPNYTGPMPPSETV